jgi:formate dehydrogenase major subunit
MAPNLTEPEVRVPRVFGWERYVRGAIANVLLAIHGDPWRSMAIHGDPNTGIHMTKAPTCALRKGRLMPAEAHV